MEIPRASFVASAPPGKASGTIAPYKISERHKRQEGIKYTNVLITINTNYMPKGEAEYNRVTTDLQELLHVIFNTNDMSTAFDFIVNPKTGEDHTGDEWKLPHILH